MHSNPLPKTEFSSLVKTSMFKNFFITLIESLLSVNIDSFCLWTENMLLNSCWLLADFSISGISQILSKFTGLFGLTSEQNLNFLSTNKKLLAGDLLSNSNCFMLLPLLIGVALAKLNNKGITKQMLNITELLTFNLLL